MMRSVFAFLAGGLFGAGLLISGMTDTRKVIGWLDLFGKWDPTLAFVLGGAIVPMAIAWNLTTRRARALLGTPFPERPEPRVGRNLVLGSVLFGIGWGMVGLCPGPAMASITWGGLAGLVFLASMILGMYLQPALRERLDRVAAALT